LSVADNARDAISLHVSASSERQECRTKAGIKKRSKHEILKFHNVYASFGNVVIFRRGTGYTFTFPSYFVSDCHITTKTKHFPQIILYPFTLKFIYWKNESFSMTTPYITYTVFRLIKTTIYNTLNSTKSTMKMYL